jgi:TolB-like protein
VTDATRGVLTTRKLTALLNAERLPGPRTRAALAEVLGSIKVSGVDAWFRRTESNYGTDKPTLDPEGTSYPVPRRRWSPVLAAYGLHRVALDRTDAEFERWVEDPQPLPGGEPMGGSGTPIDADALPSAPHQGRRPSIAVMPFRARGAAPQRGEVAELADGLTEDIVDLLARIPELIVVSRSSAAAAVPAGAEPDPRAIGETLGVRYLLEGLVACGPANVRVTVRLLDAASGRSLWSERFERSAEADLLEVQDEIALAVCARLDVAILHEDLEEASRQGDRSALRLWQEGWFRLFVDAPAPLPEHSLGLFHRALERDPDYALAHAGIAVGITTGILWGGAVPERFAEAKGHEQRARLGLPENPAVLYARAMVGFVDDVPLEEPLGYMERAVELEPSNPMYRGIIGYLQGNLGRSRAGVEQCLFAFRLAPRDAREPFMYHLLGTAYLADAQPQKALDALRQCRHYQAVDFIWVMSALAYVLLKDRSGAVDALKQIERPRSIGFYGYALKKKLFLGLPWDPKAELLELMPEAGLA